MGFAVLDIVCAIVFIGISIPLLLGKVKPNALYGFRFAKAAVSEANWYRINRCGAAWLMLWSVVILAVGVAALVRPIPIDARLRVWAVVLAPHLALIAVLQTWLYARKL